jgi:hypothetical protein
MEKISSMKRVEQQSGLYQGYYWYYYYVTFGGG